MRLLSIRLIVSLIVGITLVSLSSSSYERNVCQSPLRAPARLEPFSRAWMLEGIAAGLPKGDKRLPRSIYAASWAILSAVKMRDLLFLQRNQPTRVDPRATVTRPARSRAA